MTVTDVKSNHDVNECCGTTCNKARNLAYIRWLEKQVLDLRKQLNQLKES